MSVESQISVGGGGNPVTITITTTVGSKSVHTQESAQGTDDRLIVVHTLGALKHTIFDKDGTLFRMLPFGTAKG